MKRFDAKHAPALLAHLKEALSKPLPGPLAQLRMAPAGRSLAPAPGVTPKPAAVLLALVWHEGTLHILLTQRSARLHCHKGEISFPGGIFDCKDGDISQTALRETEEELGVPRQTFTLIGSLTPLYVPPSEALITPYVAWVETLPVLQPNPDEVDRVLLVPLSTFWKPETHHEITFEVNGRPVSAPSYRYNGAVIWGATAMMLSELLTVLEEMPEEKA